MAKLTHVNQDERFAPRAGTWNAFVDAAQWVKDKTQGSGVRGETLVDPNRISVRNDSGVDVPRYGLLWLTGIVFEGLHTISQAEYPCARAIAIAVAPIADGEIGAAWEAGKHPLLVLEYASVVVGDRLTPIGGSWYTRAFSIGPILVVGLIPESDQPTGLEANAGLVLAEIDRYRPIGD